MKKVFVVPHEITENKQVVFKIIEGIKKDELVTMNLNELDYAFVTELFEEAEIDSEIDTPVLRIDLEEETILSEVI